MQGGGIVEQGGTPKADAGLRDIGEGEGEKGGGLEAERDSKG